MVKRIWAVGASVRALAQSLTRGGFEVVAADLFCDADLSRMVEGRLQRIEQFPNDLLRLVDQVHADAWIYTGGLENYPEIVDQISERFQLLGSDGKVVRSVRDPLWLQEAIKQAGFAMPGMQTELPLEPGDWLRKSAASSGGLRVRRMRAQEQCLGTGEYYQRYVSGEVYGATFIGYGSYTQLVGVCSQLNDSSFTGAPGFHYAGSVGPVRLAESGIRSLHQLGISLAATSGLRGWFGIDLTREPGGEFLVLEVNPRFPASLELLERSLGHSTAVNHVAACLNQGTEVKPTASDSIWGKAILYATKNLVVLPDLHQHLLQLAKSNRAADIPYAGSSVPAGAPLCTLLAWGESPDHVEQQLRSQTEELRRQFDC